MLKGTIPSAEAQEWKKKAELASNAVGAVSELALQYMKHEELKIPLSGGRYFEIGLPVGVSSKDFQLLIDTLSLWRESLIQEERDDPGMRLGKMMDQLAAVLATESRDHSPEPVTPGEGEPSMAEG